jgi:general secretion pathway protein K
LDANDEVTGAAGAEEEYYREKGYHCRNGPLGSLQELMMIRGFDRELVVDGKMTDYLTVAETDGKVNINTAPIPVLHTVLGTATPTLAAPLSEGDIEDIGQYREEHDFINIKDIERVVKISAAQSGNIAPLIKVNSSFFTVTSKYTIDKVTKHVEALLKRDGNNVTVISWREF